MLLKVESILSQLPFIFFAIFLLPVVKFQNDCVKQKVEVHLLSTFGIF